MRDPEASQVGQCQIAIDFFSFDNLMSLSKLSTPSTITELIRFL